jgi:RNA polymerase sigma factor (TIGR02999 family)
VYPRFLSARRTDARNTSARTSIDAASATRYNLVIMNDVSRILHRIQQGESAAAEALLPLVYDELRKLAAARLATEAPGNTLEATALVHEAYLRLVASPPREHGQEPRWDSRGHFFAAAATAMRRILIDRARRKQRLIHGGGRRRQELHPDLAAGAVPNEELLALDTALTKLAQQDPVKARLVELRYFSGLTGEQAAQVLGISPKTADRYWVYARAWLRREMDGAAKR